MAPIATGVHLANKNQMLLGVSGDGDTASIGLGSFLHMLRRNVPMVYLVENNGVYGLTKGQFSATADLGSKAKIGHVNPYTSIDLCALALDAGATFVARSFSGDAKQLIPLLNAAFRHKGAAFIDIISPCITFANHEGSTRSFDSVKASNVVMQELGFIQPQPEVKVDYPEGGTQVVDLPDGSQFTLRKLIAADHDISRLDLAQSRLNESKAKGEFLTGMFYWKQDAKTLDQELQLIDTPLSRLATDTRPSLEAFEEMLSRYE
jgi:2-oxoglutarate ferredoxin oxidoreductase subunit beta